MANDPNQTPMEDGFPNQRLMLLPEVVLQRLASHPIAGQLYPTRIGFFPHAADHLMERREPIGDSILLLCEKGSGYGEVGDQRFKLTAGQLVILPAGLPHVYAANADDPWTISWIHFNGHLAEAYQAAIGAQPGSHTTTVHQIDRLRREFELLYSLTRGAYSDATLLALHTNLANYFAYIARARRETVPRRRECAERIAKVIEYLQEHIEHNISIESMAAIANWTPNHFSIKFREQIHETPAAFFLRLKMASACERLKEADRTIATIATELGFEDAFYFSRCFRRCYGMTPSDFRTASDF